MVDQSNKDLEEKHKSREEELEDLSLSDLEERYINTFAVEPKYGEESDDDTKKEFLARAIHAGAPNPPAPQQQAAAGGEANADDEETEGRTVTLKDGRKQVITGDMEDQIVVRQVQLQELNGGVVEIPNTEQIQSYRPEIFEKLLKQKYFSDSKIRIEIINDPRPGLAKSAKDKKSKSKATVKAKQEEV